MTGPRPPAPETPDDVPTEVEGETLPELPADRPSWGRRAWRLAREWGLTLLAVVVVWQVVGWLRAPNLPDLAPDFTLRDLDGEVVHLSDYRGRTVLLNFWATWCPPCRAEIPSFAKYAREHPDVVVLGIAADGTPRALRKAAEAMGITYRVLVGDQQTLAAYGVETLPTTVVVGPEGDVRYAHTGLMLGPQIAFAASR